MQMVRLGVVRHPLHKAWPAPAPHIFCMDDALHLFKSPSTPPGHANASQGGNWTLLDA